MSIRRCEIEWSYATGQKAVVTCAKLYQDEYAVAVLKANPAQEGRVVGWVLTHEDPQVFAQKLASYDAIEGFNPQTPEGGLYERTVTSAYLENQVREGQQQHIGEPGEAVQVYMYHRTDPCLDSPVPEGDWLQRVRAEEEAKETMLCEAQPDFDE